MTAAEYHSDGFMIGSNPSPKGGGVTVVGPDGPMRRFIYKKGLTSNEAELRSVLFAAMLATSGSTIVTDSQNTCRWVASGRPKARPDLTVFAQNAKALIRGKGLTLQWRPRRENKAGQFNEKYGSSYGTP